MLEKQGITFGICTYNRKDILEMSAKSLSAIDYFDKVHIRIYDDCSDEYDEDDLKRMFPTAISVVRSSVNSGADKNTSRMYEDFLKSEDEWLFNADSDLIYRKDIYEQIEKYSQETDGFLTLFNCISQKTISEEGDLVEKESVGAAGCLLRRDIVELILNRIKNREMKFDVNYSKLLRSEGHRLMATKESCVQHIGVSGFNSRDIRFDYGSNFEVDSMINAKIVESTFENYMESVNRFRNSMKWRVYYFIVSVPRRIRKIAGLAGARIRGGRD